MFGICTPLLSIVSLKIRSMTVAVARLWYLCIHKPLDRPAFVASMRHPIQQQHSCKGVPAPDSFHTFKSLLRSATCCNRRLDHCSLCQRVDKNTSHSEHPLCSKVSEYDHDVSTRQKQKIQTLSPNQQTTKWSPQPTFAWEAGYPVAHSSGDVQ